MTANELKTFVTELNIHNSAISRRRWELDKEIYNLSIALKEIGRLEEYEMLMNLYNEIESIDTDELVRLNIFE